MITQIGIATTEIIGRRSDCLKFTFCRRTTITTLVVWEPAAFKEHLRGFIIIKRIAVGTVFASFHYFAGGTIAARFLVVTEVTLASWRFFLIL